MKKANDILNHFFESTENEADSLIFLKSFRSIAPEKFCLIYANTDIVVESFSAIFYDLKILYSLELYPVLLVNNESISYINLFFKEIFNLFQGKQSEEPQCDIHMFSEDIGDKVKISIDNKRIPFVILDSNFDLFQKIGMLAVTLKTVKFLFLSASGSLRNTKTNQKIPMINIRSDYQRICDNNYLSDEDKILLDLLKNLLENKISHSMNIAITSPITLLKELFTVNGSGTFVKLGSEIQHLKGIDFLDKRKLTILLESAFHKKIHSNFLNAKIDSIFLESNYRGAALLKRNEFGAFLSKFAVDEIARGEGIGRDIWNEMKKKHETLFWRAKPENTIHKWYGKECQGMDKGKDWNVYWINLKVELIPQVCNFVRSQMADFVE